MQKIQAIGYILIGLALMVAGVVAEVMWLSFCFGTIIVGLVLLLRFTPLLFAPFIYLTIGGWRLLKRGINDFNVVNVDQVSAQIVPIVSPQISLIEQEVGRCAIDMQVMAYLCALAIARSGKSSMSINDALSLMAYFFSSSKYSLDMQDLPFMMYREKLHEHHYRKFWAVVWDLLPVAKHELVANEGTYLVRYILGDDSVPPF